MQSFGHQKDSPGNVPRKIASLLTSDMYTDQPLHWASSIIRTRGMSANVLERVISASPALEAATIKVVNFGNPGLAINSSGQAIEKLGIDTVWKASQVVCFNSYALAAVRSSSLSPSLLAASSRATAETASWIASRHIVDPYESFSLALWCEIGLIGSMYVFPESYDHLATTIDRRPIQAIEQEAFGFDHQLVGACIARLYKFPAPYVDFCQRHELDLLDLNLDEKLIRAAVIAVASIGGWWHPKTSRPQVTASILAGALLRDTDLEGLLDCARTSLGNSMRFLAQSQKKAV